MHGKIIYKKETDCCTCYKMQELLSDEINDHEFLEFAIDNFWDINFYKYWI